MPVLPQDDWPLFQDWPGHRLPIGLLRLETAMRKEGQNPTCGHRGEGDLEPESPSGGVQHETRRALGWGEPESKKKPSEVSLQNRP